MTLYKKHFLTTDLEGQLIQLIRILGKEERKWKEEVIKEIIQGQLSLYGHDSQVEKVQSIQNNKQRLGFYQRTSL